MFMALAILFPMLFHAVGLGATFLPMFWPIVAAAFFLNLPLAIGVGILAPLLSSLMTGMPPISPPILHVMTAEFIALTTTIVLLYRRTKLGLFWVQLIGLLVSRFVLFFIVMILAPILGLPEKLFSIGFVLLGMPGIIIMLIIIPIILNRIKREPLFMSR
jgi:hypothetical protein